MNNMKFEELTWEERKIIKDKAKEELLKEIDFEPLYEEIRNVVGDQEIYFNREIRNYKDGSIYIDIKSNDLIDKIGLMTAALKSVRLETFNSSISFNEENQKAYWWGSIDFQYELANGGSNGMHVLYFNFKNGEYTFDKVK